jgi:hypothetical protein
MHRRTRQTNAISPAVIGVAISLGLAFAPVPGGIARSAIAQETICAEGDESLQCKAQAGDRVALYVLGRQAYDEARNSGDFSEALRLARQLDATGDKNGDRLLKMVYLQLGWGGHSDYVQAYVWLSEAIAGGKDYLVSWRDRLAAKMSADQLALAREIASN